MAGQNRLEILIRAVADQAIKEFNDLNKAVNNTETTTQKTSGVMGLFQGVLMGVGMQAMNMAQNLLASIPAMIELGDEVSDTKQALAGYAGGALEAEVYTNALVEAAGNAIDPMTAMHSAAKLLSLGLVNTKDEAAELTNIAVTLGRAMGKDAKESMEEFTNLMAMKATRRLQEFGISADEVTKIMGDLESQGFSESEKQARFMNATLQVARKRMGELADAGFDATDGMDEMKASIAEAKQEMATMLWDVVLPMIEAMTELRKANKSFQQQALESSNTLDDYMKAMLSNVKGAAMISSGWREARTAEWEHYQQLKKTEEAMVETGKAADELAEKELEAGEAADQAAEMHQAAFERMMEIVKNEVGETYDTFLEKLSELEGKQGELNAEYEKFRDIKPITAAELTMIEEYGTAIGTIEEAIGNYEEAIKTADAEAIPLLEQHLGEMKTLLEGYKSKVDELEEKKYLTEQQGEELGKAKEAIDNNTEAIEALKKKHDEQTAKMLFNMVAQRVAMDNIVTEAENLLLGKLMVDLGLINDTQVNAILAVEDAMKIVHDSSLAADDAARIAAAGILNFHSEIDATPDMKTVTILTNYVYQGGPGPKVTGGYQHGGQFTVGGRSGIDKNLVMFRASRGETVTVTPAGEKGSGGVTFNLINQGMMLSNPKDLERIIIPMVERGIRNDKMRNK